MTTVRMNVLVVWIAAVVANAAAAHAQTPAYTFTKIQFPGAISTEPYGISNSGQIVGTYKDAAGISHGFLFDGTTYTPIRFPGAVYSYALGISNSGQILGSHSFDTAIGPYHSFVTEGDTYVEFDFPGKESDARGMNASGQIVGVYNSGFGTKDFGFLRTGDTYTTIDFPGATFTYAWGINDAGLVTGTYRDSLLRLHGFSYVNGAYKPINFPGATETYLGRLNNLNAAVGWSIQCGRIGGYVFSEGRTFDPIKVSLAGATDTRPRAINDAGEIVGVYTSPDCTLCGFVARPNPGGTPVCRQSTALSYQDGTLSFSYDVGTTIPTTWTAWIFLQNVPFRLWAAPMPVISPGASGVLPLGSIPPSGTATIISIFSTPADGNLCVQYSVVDTGTASP